MHYRQSSTARLLKIVTPLPALAVIWFPTSLLPLDERMITPGPSLSFMIFINGTRCASDRGRRHARADKNPTAAIAQVAGAAKVRPNVGVIDDVLSGGADDRNAVSAIFGNGHSVFDRGLKATNGVPMGMSIDQDAIP